MSSPDDRPQEGPSVEIDASKDRLDVVVGSTGTRRTFDNVVAGHAALVKHLRAVTPVRVVLGGIGGYKPVAVSALAAGGVLVIALSPQRPRDCKGSRSAGLLIEWRLEDGARRGCCFISSSSGSLTGRLHQRRQKRRGAPCRGARGGLRPVIRDMGFRVAALSSRDPAWRGTSRMKWDSARAITF